LKKEDTAFGATFSNNKRVIHRNVKEKLSDLAIPLQPTLLNGIQYNNTTKCINPTY